MDITMLSSAEATSFCTSTSPSSISIMKSVCVTSLSRIKTVPNLKRLGFIKPTTTRASEALKSVKAVGVTSNWAAFSWLGSLNGLEVLKNNISEL